MTYHNKTLGLAGAAALSMLAAGAHAATLKVEVWDVLAPEPGCCTPGNDEQDQIDAWSTAPANEIALRPDATFSPTPTSNEFLNANYFTGGFETSGSFGDNDWAGVDYIVGNLSSDLTFTIDSADLVSGFSAVSLSSSSSTPTIDDFFGTSLGGVGSNAILGTVARITGTLSVTAGDEFTITSDDGYRLTVGGTELAFVPNLQDSLSATSSQIGASGFQKFELLWFEANTVGATLKVEGNFTPVPLPAAGWLMLAGFGGLAALRRRKRAA